MSLRKKKMPVPVEVKGIQLRCQICSNDTFYTKRTLLNTTLLSFLNLDWLNRNATCFVCSECTHIIWFES